MASTSSRLANILHWIKLRGDHSLRSHYADYKIAREMRLYLVQSSGDREYQLFCVIQTIKQSDCFIRDFYIEMIGYWKELQTRAHTSFISSRVPTLL